MKEESKNIQAAGTTNNTNNTNNKETKKGKKAMNTTPAKELTAEQKTQLQKLSKEILGNLTKNYALGKALIEVKALLEGTAEKFEPYCKEHFNLAHSQVNRLMNYAKVRDNIGMGNQAEYISENTLRGLDRFTAEIQKQIWEEAKRLAGDQKMPTTAQVQEARKKVAPKTEQDLGDKKKQFLTNGFYDRFTADFRDLHIRFDQRLQLLNLITGELLHLLGSHRFTGGCLHLE